MTAQVHIGDDPLIAELQREEGEERGGEGLMRSRQAPVSVGGAVSSVLDHILPPRPVRQAPCHPYTTAYNVAQVCQASLVLGALG